nr:MAG TPA: repressor domain protein [Caudoviricetes sp.]
MGIMSNLNCDKNMNKIQIFQNEQFGKVRIAMNENEEPLFCLADVCSVIGIANARNVKSRLDLEDVCQMDTLTEGGKQQVTFITESGLYDVIIRSDSEKAKPFRKWVTSEVLPSIRKHGAYMTQETLEKALTSPDFLIQLATNLKEEKQKRIEAEQKVELAEQTIKNNAPKVLFADAVSTSQRSCLVAELAKILQQNGVNIGQNRLFAWMRENGYLCSKGQYYNQPTQKAMDLGLFELKQTTINKPDGSILVSTTTKVTGKGQVYFVNKFLGKDAA